MVRSMIEAEVGEIAELADWFDERNGVMRIPDGYGEMPVEVKVRLMEEIDSLRRMYNTDGIDVTSFVEGMRGVIRMAFLMGRRFGKLEASSGVSAVAKTVRMCKGVPHV